MQKVILFGVVATLTMMGTMAPAEAGKKSDSVVKVKARLVKSAAGKEVVVVNLDIDKGWHLYANPVDHEGNEGSRTEVKITNVPAVIEYPVGKVSPDPKLEKSKIYEGNVVIRATLDRPSGDTNPIEVSVRLSSCNDGTCLQPETVKLTAR